MENSFKARPVEGEIDMVALRKAVQEKISVSRALLAGRYMTAEEVREAKTLIGGDPGSSGIEGWGGIDKGDGGSAI